MSSHHMARNFPCCDTLLESYDHEDELESAGGIIKLTRMITHVQVVDDYLDSLIVAEYKGIS
jgi:hypothetical protein